jgi:hypothetical protein
VYKNDNLSFKQPPISQAAKEKATRNRAARGGTEGDNDKIPCTSKFHFSKGKYGNVVLAWHGVLIQKAKANFTDICAQARSIFRATDVGKGSQVAQTFDPEIRTRVGLDSESESDKADEDNADDRDDEDPQVQDHDDDKDDEDLQDRDDDKDDEDLQDRDDDKDDEDLQDHDHDNNNNLKDHEDDRNRDTQAVSYHGNDGNDDVDGGNDGNEEVDRGGPSRRRSSRGSRK